jgi:sulfide:quinone oxidoreductase
VARVVILGAGISGHTAALHLRRQVKKGHEITVVSPNASWNWIPSNIWVGVGKMTRDQVTFPLAPIYRRKHIDFRQPKAVAIHPEGSVSESRGFVNIVYTDPARASG